VLQVLSANIRREEGTVHLFELGRVYLRRDGALPLEPEILCALMVSGGPDKRWHGRQEPVDFYDAKGVAESLLSELKVDAAYTEGADPGLRPGAQAAVLAGGNPVGMLGEIHPDVARAFELPAGVYLLELNLSTLLSQAGDFTYRALPRFPVVERDLALVVDDAVSHQQVVDIIEKHRLVSSVRLFDVYSGKQVAAGKKSLAYKLTFQSPDHTLKDAEVDGVLSAIVKELGAKAGAALRS
jgi:phenylalanyl-tRNA synthetase beta chain